MFHGLRACFQVHVCMWRIQVCVCVMEKKEKTAYLEYMIEKSFGIIKSNISQVNSHSNKISRYYNYYINKIYDIATINILHSDSILYNTILISVLRIFI